MIQSMIQYQHFYECSSIFSTNQIQDGTNIGSYPSSILSSFHHSLFTQLTHNCQNQGWIDVLEEYWSRLDMMRDNDDDEKEMELKDFLNDDDESDDESENESENDDKSDNKIQLNFNNLMSLPILIQYVSQLHQEEGLNQSAIKSIQEMKCVCHSFYHHIFSFCSNLIFQEFIMSNFYRKAGFCCDGKVMMRYEGIR